MIEWSESARKWKTPSREAGAFSLGWAVLRGGRPAHRRRNLGLPVNSAFLLTESSRGEGKINVALLAAQR